MPRSQTANRRKKTFGKVARKAKNIQGKIRKTPKSERFQNSALTYDEKTTQFANYERLGLMADANQIGANTNKLHVTGFNPRVKGDRIGSAASSSDQPHPLELEVPEGLKTVRKVPDGERKVLLALMAAHGESYSAMARDMRLNALQHTAAHLRRRIAKMLEEDQEDAEAAEAAATGSSMPPHRLQPKSTKDPNKAFSKKSMHFN